MDLLFNIVIECVIKYAVLTSQIEGIKIHICKGKQNTTRYYSESDGLTKHINANESQWTECMSNHDYSVINMPGVDV